MSTIHNPSRFVPEDYCVVDYLDNRPPEALGFFLAGDAEAAALAYNAAREQYHLDFARYFGWVDEGVTARVPHNCQHCGHWFRYVVVASYRDEFVAFGCDCAKRIDLTIDEFQMKCLKEVARKRAESIRLGSRYARLLSDHPELAKAF